MDVTCFLPVFLQCAGLSRRSLTTKFHKFQIPTTKFQTARERMLMDGLDATTAAYEVGYESVSQFSREYSRFFGLPPIRDVKALKGSNTAMVNAV
jgi:AraC-like DNA-binding protein